MLSNIPGTSQHADSVQTISDSEESSNVAAPKPEICETFIDRGSKENDGAQAIVTTSGNVYSNPRRQTQSLYETTDELRLLGGGTQQDPEAVPISIPQHRSTLSRPKVMISGGPRPINSLGSSSSASQQPLRNGFGSWPKISRALTTETAYGDNLRGVNNRVNSLDRAEASLEDSQPKRRRLNHSSHRRDSIFTVEDQDEVDMINPENGAEQNLPSSKRSSNVSSTRGPSLGHVHEGGFMNLEKMMTSSSGRQRYGPRGNSGHKVDNPIVADISRTASPSPEVEELEQRPATKPRWKGTANRSASLHPHSNRTRFTARPESSRTIQSTSLRNPGSNDIRSKGNGLYETGETSRHFDKGISPPGPLGRKGKSNGPGDGIHSRDTSPNLRDGFVDSHGRRRNSKHSNTSSDELSNDPSSYAAVTREAPRQVRQINPRRSPDQSAPSHGNRIKGLAPSNIRASKFSERKQDPVVQETSSAKSQSSGSAEFKATLMFYRSSECTIGAEKMHETKHELVYDSDERVFNIYANGSNISKGAPKFQMRPEKILRAICSDSSPKIRLKCSNSGNLDSLIDIEFGSPKEACDIVLFLRNISKFDEFQKPCDWLDKAFSNRTAENLRNTMAGRSKQRNVDLDLMEKNKRRRDRNVDASQQLHEMGFENTPRKRRIIDNLNSYDTHKSSERSATEPWMGTHAPSSQDRSAERLLRSSQRTADMNGATLANPHSTRSRMAFAMADSPPAHKRTDVLLSPLERLLPGLRYSELHDHGDPWKRPLIFPETGKKKTTVEFDDLERLDEGEFLNDNLIGFYLRKLEHQLEQSNPKLAKKIYFFNTYFYTSLTNTQRGQKINYEGVQKWTRGIDIFSYNFVVVPINEATHWYVAIICNLPALTRDGDATDDESPDSLPTNICPDIDPDDKPYESVHPESKDDVLCVLEKNLQEEPYEHHTAQSLASLSIRDEIESELKQGEHIDVDKDGKLAQREDLNRLKASEASRSESDTNTAVKAEAEQGKKHDSQQAEDGNATSPAKKKPSTPGKKGKRKLNHGGNLNRRNPRYPTIITLDSLGLNHPQTVRALKEYLQAEGRSKRNGMEWEESRLRGMTAREIPQQDNFCDCGLFLLGYIDKFLQAPGKFVAKILRREYDVKNDWPDMVPSDLRTRLREQILSLHRKQEKEAIMIQKAKAQSKKQETALSGLTLESVLRKDTDKGETDPTLSSILGSSIEPPPISQFKKGDTLEGAPSIDKDVASKDPAPSTVKFINNGARRNYQDIDFSISRPLELVKSNLGTAESPRDANSPNGQAEFSLGQDPQTAITIIESQTDAPESPCKRPRHEDKIELITDSVISSS